MSTQEIVEEILEHHGIKGMKWGVRKTFDTAFGTKSAGRRPSSYKKKSTNIEPTRKVRKADKKFEKSINLNTWIKINNAAATATNSKHIDRINNKPEYKKAAARGDFHDASKPITQKYYKEHQDAFLSEVRKAADNLGTNASGTRKYQISNDANGNWSVSTTEVKHDDSSFTIKVITNDLGEIINLELLDEMKQDVMTIDEFLSHFGIKGMKWGVRRDRSSNVTVSDKGKKIKTSGGVGRPAHPDAVRAHGIGQVAKKSGTKALSNDELQAYAKRLQLEQNVSQLTTRQSSKGSKFAKNVLGRVGNKVVDEVLNTATNGVKTAIRRQMMFR